MAISDMKPKSETSGKVRIAIYDMDKTITRGATYNNFLLHMALARAPWRLLLMPMLIPGIILYGFKVWDRKALKQYSQRLLVGPRVDRLEIEQHLESHATKVMAENIHVQARARILAEKADGYRLVVATASYRLYVEAIARHFEFDDVIATELATDESGHILPQIDGENCYYNAKLERVESWLQEAGLRREDCHIRAYSDHISDAPLLEFADKAFATNPHPPLAKLAKEKRWKILDWRR